LATARERVGRALSVDAANAAQQRAVVLMLLKLLTVSPHPPSAF
jgi:hypothetical protein